MMKLSLFVALSLLASAIAFAPQQTSIRVSVARNALFDNIANMDLWAPISDSNTYGARKKKNVGVGKLSSNAYVPDGLTKSQYESVRASEQAKKAANYDKNVKKAFKFLGFNEFYQKRGTNLDGGWKKDINLGHRMAKTKFDWSGKKEETKLFESNKLIKTLKQK